MLRFPLLIALFAASLPAAAGNLLTASEAFPIQAHATADGGVILMVGIEPGYALYRRKFAVAGGGGFAVSAVDMPRGTVVDDPDLGPLEQYTAARVPVAITGEGLGTGASLSVTLQGCAPAFGVCFNPITRSIPIVALP